MEQMKKTEAGTSQRRSGTAFVCRRGSHWEKLESLGGAGTKVLVLKLDIAANPEEDARSAFVWSYLWGLAGRGRIGLILATLPKLDG